MHACMHVCMYGIYIWLDNFGQYFFRKVMNFLWPQWSTVDEAHNTDILRVKMLAEDLQTA